MMMRLDEDGDEEQEWQWTASTRREMSTREELSPEISKAGLIHFFNPAGDADALSDNDVGCDEAVAAGGSCWRATENKRQMQPARWATVKKKKKRERFAAGDSHQRRDLLLALFAVSYALRVRTAFPSCLTHTTHSLVHRYSMREQAESSFRLAKHRKSRSERETVKKGSSQHLC